MNIHVLTCTYRGQRDKYPNKVLLVKILASLLRGMLSFLHKDLYAECLSSSVPLTDSQSFLSVGLKSEGQHISLACSHLNTFLMGLKV